MQPHAMGDTVQATGMTPEELHELMFHNKDEKTLILIDTRPLSDYVVGHLVNAHTVKLSSMLLRRLAQNKIALKDLIKEDEREAFVTNCKADNNPVVVVYDAATTTADGAPYDQKNPLHVILRSLQHDGVPCYFLKGGFEAMKAKYDVVEASKGNVPAGIGFSLPVQQLQSADKQKTPTTPIERHHRDAEPCEILPYMYVGAEAHAEKEEIVRKHGITHILNLTTRSPTRHPHIEYCVIEILDSWNQNLIAHFGEAFEFIERAREAGGKVLVHCVAGISRSPSVAIAYLMFKNKMSLSDAYALVKKKRPSISPNLDFMAELQQYEKQIKAADPSFEASGWGVGLFGEEDRTSPSSLLA
ncbi:hypothetical protein PTSG_09628 [Salpingoeca rosetta]|uniref:Uncharacterized protein n=1 Tax=Salpingoeca rosetta (strain ATCC 50818 / BSB-021) TaxID=946362 RepID=F2ULJ4_SALR5|nr:uncharacterized protein PTSG_09628 [Salpingoeca rosetta]EGD77993.1 hypothetical protein PTSG_09628 [Salpingoeca rosetta]|eukprot:XP_004990055.1 hypothetical protein PTSG_09628 [Salpingoeca rosetta]